MKSHFVRTVIGVWMFVGCDDTVTPLRSAEGPPSNDMAEATQTPVGTWNHPYWGPGALRAFVSGGRDGNFGHYTPVPQLPMPGPVGGPYSSTAAGTQGCKLATASLTPVGFNPYTNTSGGLVYQILSPEDAFSFIASTGALQTCGYPLWSDFGGTYEGPTTFETFAPFTLTRAATFTSNVLIDASISFSPNHGAVDLSATLSVEVPGSTGWSQIAGATFHQSSNGTWIDAPLYFTHPLSPGNYRVHTKINVTGNANGNGYTTTAGLNIEGYATVQ